MRCWRCDTETAVTIMSKFNRDILCMNCKKDEQLAPNYRRASAAEDLAVRDGDLNYPGVGLSPEDTGFLTFRRAIRDRG